MARLGKAWSTRRVTGRHRGSSPRHPRSRRGLAGQGTARLGRAWQGMEHKAGDRQAPGFEPLAPTLAAGQGMAGRGVSRRGLARLGKAWSTNGARETE
jgi:hypothetical protein